jgi:hypothetical protein
MYPSISDSNYIFENQTQIPQTKEIDLSTKPLPNFDFDFEKSFLFQPSNPNHLVDEQPKSNQIQKTNVEVYIPQEVNKLQNVSQESFVFEKFVKLGFSQDLILFAMDVYHLDSSSIENFLTNFKNLTDFGFGDLKVKEALLLKENKFEEALDYLTNEEK